MGFVRSPSEQNAGKGVRCSVPDEGRDIDDSERYQNLSHENTYHALAHYALARIEGKDSGDTDGHVPYGKCVRGGEA